MDDSIVILNTMFNDGVGYLWFIMLAAWGGTVNYITRLKNGHQFKWLELISEWMISAFSGLLTAYACAESELSWNVTAVMVGVAGHMGGQGIYLVQNAVKKRLKYIIKPPSED